MSGKLTSFRIESDSAVWLSFADGSRRSVPIESLDQFISGRDLSRVRKALNLRQRYFRRILPPWAKALAIGSMCLAVAAGGLQVASWSGRRAAEQPTGGQTGSGDPTTQEPSGGTGTHETAGPATVATTDHPAAGEEGPGVRRHKRQIPRPEKPLEMEVMGLIRSIERRLVQ